MDTSHIYNMVSGLTPNAALIISGIIAGIIAIIGAIIGGVITGRYMMKQNKENFEYNLHLSELEDKKAEVMVLLALKIEIEAIRRRHDTIIRPKIEESLELQDPRDSYILLSYRISIPMNYFTIYEGNSSFIGKIRNESLIKEIVTVYTDIKEFLESILIAEKQKIEIEKIITDNSERKPTEENFGDWLAVKEFGEFTNLEVLKTQIKDLKAKLDNLDIQINKLKTSLEQEIKNIEQTIHT